MNDWVELINIVGKLIITLFILGFIVYGLFKLLYKEVK